MGRHFGIIFNSGCVAGSFVCKWCFVRRKRASGSGCELTRVGAYARMRVLSFMCVMYRRACQPTFSCHVEVDQEL